MGMLVDARDAIAKGNATDAEVSGFLNEAVVRLERVSKGTNMVLERFFEKQEDIASFELGRCKSSLARAVEKAAAAAAVTKKKREGGGGGGGNEKVAAMASEAGAQESVAK